jgi:hypothetical protein
MFVVDDTVIAHLARIYAACSRVTCVFYVRVPPSVLVKRGNMTPSGCRHSRDFDCLR